MKVHSFLTLQRLTFPLCSFDHHKCFLTGTIKKFWKVDQYFMEETRSVLFLKIKHFLCMLYCILVSFKGTLLLVYYWMTLCYLW